jgi:hypothetical protein
LPTNWTVAHWQAVFVVLLFRPDNLILVAGAVARKVVVIGNVDGEAL